MRPLVGLWYNNVAVAAVAARQKGENVFEGYLAMHPVRHNYTCLSLALQYALEKAPQEWSRWRTDMRLMRDMQGVFPYFCNNAWLMRAELYNKVLDLFFHATGGASLKQASKAFTSEQFSKFFRSAFMLSSHVNPNDEELMNRVVRNTPELGFCALKHSFGIHPAYNIHPHWRNPFDDMAGEAVLLSLHVSPKGA